MVRLIKVRNKVAAVVSFSDVLFKMPWEDAIDIEVRFIPIADFIDPGERGRGIHLKLHLVALMTCDRVVRRNGHDRLSGRDESVSNIKNESFTDRESGLLDRILRCRSPKGRPRPDEHEAPGHDDSEEGEILAAPIH